MTAAALCLALGWVGEHEQRRSLAQTLANERQQSEFLAQRVTPSSIELSPALAPNSFLLVRANMQEHGVDASLTPVAAVAPSNGQAPSIAPTVLHFGRSRDLLDYDRSDPRIYISISALVLDRRCTCLTI